MLLIGAHFASLVMLPAGRLLITELAGHIEEHKQLAEKVTPLKGTLEHFKKHAKKARGSTMGEQRVAPSAACPPWSSSGTT